MLGLLDLEVNLGYEEVTGIRPKLLFHFEKKKIFILALRISDPSLSLFLSLSSCFSSFLFVSLSLLCTSVCMCVCERESQFLDFDVT